MNTCLRFIASAAVAAAVLMPPLAVAQPRKPITIGLAVANLDSDFFNQIKQSVEASAGKKGIKVITVDAKGDSATQARQIQELIMGKIDALIYIPAGATAPGVPVQAAKAA